MVAERMFPEQQITRERIHSLGEFVTDFSLAGMRALVQNNKGWDGLLGIFAVR